MPVLVCTRVCARGQWQLLLRKKEFPLTVISLPLGWAFAHKTHFPDSQDPANGAVVCAAGTPALLSTQPELLKPHITLSRGLLVCKDG